MTLHLILIGQKPEILLFLSNLGEECIDFQRAIMVFPGYLPSPYWKPHWICRQHTTCQWSLTSICCHSMWFLVWSWSHVLWVLSKNNLLIFQFWLECDDMELPHTKGHTCNPWNKCPKRGLLTTGGQIPIKKHYHSFCHIFRATEYGHTYVIFIIHRPLVITANPAAVKVNLKGKTTV